jgi:DNA-binding response OmpR family regulator
MKKILLIEDDHTIVEALEDTFRFHDYDVSIAGNGKDGIRLFREHSPDIIILDVMLPGVDGFEICKKIKHEEPHTPIIMLTAKGQENDKLLGFELGADDYVTKPFSIKELVARVSAVLKRSAAARPPAAAQQQEPSNTVESLTIGNAIINFKHFTVVREGTEHSLSSKECDILKLLTEHPDEVIDRNRIIDVVWGDEYFPSPRTIDNFILKLRNKIEDDPRNPVFLLTVHGVGYKYRR